MVSNVPVSRGIFTAAVRDCNTNRKESPSHVEDGGKEKEGREMGGGFFR